MTHDFSIPAVEQNRILFVGNPWPEGHSFDLGWEVRIAQDGLYFDFDGSTDDYDAEDEDLEIDEADDGLDDEVEEEDEEDGGGEGDWTSKTVWNNYNACEISSEKGIKVADEESPIALTKLSGKTFIADLLPVDMEDDDLACRIYLLGHDSIANHEITFEKRSGTLEYSITWQGKIALTYSGDNEFRYNFIANGTRKLERISVGQELEEDAAQTLFSKFVEDADLFEFKNGAFYYKGK